MRSQTKARASAPRTGKLCPREAGASPIFPVGKALTGSYSRNPGRTGISSGSLGHHRATAHQEECAKLPKRLQHAHTLTWEQLGGTRVVAPQRGGCEARSVNPTVQARSTGRRGHSPRSSLPLGQAESRRAQNSRDATAPS